VDRFTWDGSTLSFDMNLMRLRARQTDNIATSGHPAPTTPTKPAITMAA
jgi:hypothetical protein